MIFFNSEKIQGIYHKKELTWQKYIFLLETGSFGIIKIFGTKFTMLNPKNTVLSLYLN